MALRGGPTEQCRSEGMPSPSEAPSGGAKAFCLLLRSSKVSRRKGGTISSRYKKTDIHTKPRNPPIENPHHCGFSNNAKTSINLSVQLTLQIPLIHSPRRNRLDLRSITRRTKRLITRNTNIPHRRHGRAQEFTRVKLARVGRHQPTHRTSRSQTQTGIDIDLAHTVLDTYDDLLTGTPQVSLMSPPYASSVAN